MRCSLVTSEDLKLLYDRMGIASLGLTLTVRYGTVAILLYVVTSCDNVSAIKSQGLTFQLIGSKVKVFRESDKAY